MMRSVDSLPGRISEKLHTQACTHTHTQQNKQIRPQPLKYVEVVFKLYIYSRKQIKIQQFSNLDERKHHWRFAEPRPQDSLYSDLLVGGLPSQSVKMSAFFILPYK